MSAADAALQALIARFGARVRAQILSHRLARPGIDVGSLDDALGAARDSGLRHLDAIAEAAAAEVRLPVETCLSYLRDNLHFHLGPRELEGLDLFRSHAIKLGLAPADAPRAERLVRT